MKTLLALLILLAAAGLEAGGDALMRGGLFGATPIRRLLLGVYVAAFFVMAQVINWLAFGQKPGLPILVGGFVVLGGGILSFWRP